jgi:hypothetical protein
MQAGFRFCPRRRAGQREAMASEGQLEALYRFLNDDGVGFARILTSIASATQSTSSDALGADRLARRPLAAPSTYPASLA